MKFTKMDGLAMRIQGPGGWGSGKFIPQFSPHIFAHIPAHNLTLFKYTFHALK